MACASPETHHKKSKPEAFLGGGCIYPWSKFQKQSFHVWRRKPCCCQHCVCVYHRHHRSWNPSSCRFSPFHLFYVTNSRICHLSEFNSNKASSQGSNSTPPPWIPSLGRLTPSLPRTYTYILRVLTQWPRTYIYVLIQMRSARVWFFELAWRN